MKQEEMDELLKKIEQSAQDVPMPEGLEPEQMMEKLKQDGQSSKNGRSGQDGQDGQDGPGGRRRWKRPVEYGAIAAAALLTVLTVNQIQSAKSVAEPVRPETTSAAADTAGTGAALAGAETAAPEDTAALEGTAAPAETAAPTDTADGVETAAAGQYVAKSYEDIYERIRQYRVEPSAIVRNGAIQIKPGMAVEETMAAAGAVKGEAFDEAAGTGEAGASSTGTEARKDYSGTNLQVEGVDEGDVVKTDGRYLYILSQDTGRIQIVEANGVNPKKSGVIGDTSTVEEARNIREFYVYDDKLSVVRQAYMSYEEQYGEEAARERFGKARYAYPRKGITYLETYDISDRDNPRLLGTVSQDGDYKDSRRVGDYIYLFTSDCSYDIRGVKDVGSYVPSINKETIPYDCIYIPENINSPRYVVISSVDMKEPDRTVSQKAVMADGGHVYVSSAGIYIGSEKYDSHADQYDYTELLKLSYKDGRIAMKAHGNIDGYLNDQFSMDEYEGNLRVVSTLSYNTGKSTNSLYVLDENLKRIGEIEDLAPGEQIYSARFMGDTGYFVTYRNMDPLFSVDLSTPSAPKILGELTITGFSEYLHPYAEDLLLGIGRETDPDTGNFKGLKLSMFDTENPKDVKEMQKQVEESFEYSPAWGSHKAVLISPGKGLIGFAVGVSDKETRAWSNQYVVYSYDRQAGFRQEMAYELSKTDDLETIRGLYIGSCFYVVGNDSVTAFTMEDFTQGGQLKY